MRPLLGQTLVRCALLCALAWASPAALLAQATSAPVQAAQTSQPSEAALAEARTLFQRGVALADQGQFAAAAQRFREALAIHAAPPISYNLAAALYELQQYDESFDRAQTVLRDPESNEALRERARKLEQSLSSHVARLTVTASGTAAAGVSVRIDGQPLDRALLGVPRAIAPGTHQLTTERQGQSVSQRAVEVPPGTAVIVDLSLIATDATSPRAVAEAAEGDGQAVPAPAAGRDDDARRRKIWLWSGVAAGAVLVATGVVLAVVLTKDDPKPRTSTQGDFMPGVLTWD